MCGRYSVLTEDEIIEVRGIIKSIAMKLVRDEIENCDDQRKEIAPTNRAPIVTSNGNCRLRRSPIWSLIARVNHVLNLEIRTLKVASS